MQPKSNAWVIVLRPGGETYEVALWLPGLHGMPNLFTYSADESGKLASVGSVMNSAMLVEPSSVSPAKEPKKGPP